MRIAALEKRVENLEKELKEESKATSGNTRRSSRSRERKEARMSEATNTKETCPHCGTPYYPVWTTNALSSVSPSRQETITIGDLGATTCYVL